MKNKWAIFFVVMIGVVAAFASTPYRDLIISASAWNGGTINGAVIGGTTPAAGTFSALTLSGGGSGATCLASGVFGLCAGGSNACASFSSSATSGCTVLPDGKWYEWVQGPTANLTACNVGSPGSAPSGYSGLCSEPILAVTWPVTFTTACYAPGVTDNNSGTDPTDGSTGQTFASGSWMGTATPTTSGWSIQRTFAYSDAGTRALLSSYDGFPTAYCIGK